MSRTTPNNPANALTPSYSTVSSPAGFQSGDLVYYKDSSFGTIPGNAVSTANFALNAVVNQNQTAFNTTVNYANYNPTTRTGSTNNRAPSSALLTSGNIVLVFGEHGSSNGEACFKIIDQDGVVVVNRTSLGFNVQNMGCIGVAALTGGGFAVAFKQLSGYMRVGVYSNTGTVVTAVAEDTNFGTSFDNFDIKPLSGGGFAIGTRTSGANYGFRAYSSVGVGGGYVTDGGWNGQAAVVITAFSDNSYAALFPAASTTLKISRFSNTGAFVTNYTAASDWYSTGGYEFITLSTDVGVVLYVENATGSYYTYSKTYTQSTGALSGPTNFGYPYQQAINAKALSAGGFVMTTAMQGTGIMRIVQRNAALSQTATLDLLGLPGYFQSSQASAYQNTTIIEGGTYITVVDNSYNTTSHSYHSMPYIQINKADYTVTGIRRRFPAAATVASIAAPVSGYARGNSTPNSAAFLAQNTQTLTRTIPVTTSTNFTLTPYTAISEQVNTQAMVDMANGQFVIAYTTGGSNVKFTVFNPDGSTVSTTVVDSSATNQFLVRATCLGNGKLVISWVPQNNAQVNFAVYSSTYALLATGSTAGLYSGSLQNPGSQNSASGHDIAPFGNDSFVFSADVTGSTIVCSVFNDSAVSQSLSSNSHPGGCQSIRIASDSSGDVAVKFYASSAGQGYIYWFARDTTTNSTFFYNQNTLGNYNANNYGENMVMTPYGSVYGLGANGSQRTAQKVMPGSQYTYNLGTMGYNAQNLCVGQYGEVVGLRLEGGAQQWIRYSVCAGQGPFGSTVAQTNIDVGNMTINDYNTVSTYGSQSQIANLYDNIYAFSYITSSRTIKVGLLNTVAATYSQVITAGVTPSSTALIPAPSNGYYLAGVSASDCAAGGTGVLQVNGVAALSSQYPAGTASQAFDFTAPALDTGVRGTIAGRNVIISGAK